MSWLGSLIGSATGTAASTVIGSIGDAAVKMREAITGDIPPEKKAELQMRLAELEAQITSAQSSIIIAEAQGQSWMQRNWRPCLMMVIVAIVANNYIIFPYANIFTDKVKILDLPDKLWALMEIGVGGYILGRTVEKVKGQE
ncbi:MAG: hypothetical protein HY883_02805 [Deltaproteobacteria bacterium]|nr:hypothetical protein [Deltaproteobacteria bacterium]